MAIYIKKPVTIEAHQFIGTNYRKILDFVGYAGTYDKGTEQIVISTSKGFMRANVDDWIIKGLKGEFYPCKPDIFEATYAPEHSDAV